MRTSSAGRERRRVCTTLWSTRSFDVLRPRRRGLLVPGGLVRDRWRPSPDVALAPHGRDYVESFYLPCVRRERRPRRATARSRETSRRHSNGFPPSGLPSGHRPVGHRCPRRHSARRDRGGPRSLNQRRHRALWVAPIHHEPYPIAPIRRTTRPPRPLQRAGSARSRYRRGPRARVLPCHPALADPFVPPHHLVGLPVAQVLRSPRLRALAADSASCSEYLTRPASVGVLKPKCLAVLTLRCADQADHRCSPAASEPSQRSRRADVNR